MKQIFAAALAAASLIFAPHAAEAQEINMRSFACEAFTALPENTRHIVIAWMQGFDTDDDGELLLDVEEVEDDAEALAGFCGKNPSVPLMDAVEQAFQ